MSSGRSFKDLSRAPGMACLRLRSKNRRWSSGFMCDKHVAIGVVVDALEGKFGLGLEGAGGAQDVPVVLTRIMWSSGRLNGADPERLAFGPADQVALVAILRGQQIAGVLIRRVHQHVFARSEFARRRWRG